MVPCAVDCCQSCFQGCKVCRAVSRSVFVYEAEMRRPEGEGRNGRRWGNWGGNCEVVCGRVVNSLVSQR